MPSTHNRKRFFEHSCKRPNVRHGSIASFWSSPDYFRSSIDPAQVRQLKAEGSGPSQIARKLGIARASVYRALEGH